MASKIKSDGTILVQSVGSDPGSPENGQFWYNSAAKKFRFYQNDEVKELGSGTSYTCQLYNSAAVSISNDTETELTWDSEDADSGMHGTTNPAEVAIVVTTNYRISASAIFAANGVGKRELRIYHNGVPVAFDHDLNPSASEVSILRADVTIHLTSGDVITVRVLQDSGSSLDVTGDLGSTDGRIGGMFSVTSV